MHPRENSSGENPKLVDRNSTGHFSRRIFEDEHLEGYLPLTKAAPESAAAEPSVNIGGRIGIHTKNRSQAGLNKQIISLETAARRKHLAAIQTTGTKAPSSSFQQYLENCILPAFSRIGIDYQIAKSFFLLAAPAWELMGPISRTRHWCTRKLIEEIDEIRDGIVLKANREHDARRWLTTAADQDLLEVVKLQMQPENLMGLIDEITTPWIILPRAYQHLKKQHSRYLPAYLRFVESETNTECNRVFIRIIIDFTANFTLKFAPENCSQEKLTEILVSGYETMFWKNLRCPPEGLEEIMVSENFLNWIKLFQARQNTDSRIVHDVISRMEAALAKLFAVKSNQELPRKDTLEGDRFIVILRHGSRGIQTLLRHFGQGTPFTNFSSDEHRQNPPDLRNLRILCRSIKSCFRSETQHTQKSIRTLLAHLKLIFDTQYSPALPVRNGGQKVFRFAGPRAVNMIRALSAEID